MSKLEPTAENSQPHSDKEYIPLTFYFHESDANSSPFVALSGMIDWYAEHGDLDALKEYHKECPSIDLTANNNSAIHKAAKNGHLSVVKYLCENGVDLEIIKHTDIYYRVKLAIKHDKNTKKLAKLKAENAKLHAKIKKLRN